MSKLKLLHYMECLRTIFRHQHLSSFFFQSFIFCNVNILAVAADRQNDPVLKKVGELYHTEAVNKYVQEHFGGTKIDVNKPITYLTATK